MTVALSRSGHSIIQWLTVGVIILCLPLLFHTVLYAPDGIDSPKGEIPGPGGWWGDATANVNWCEADYVVFRGVAEFWNTLSSLAMVCHGVYGILRHWGQVETRFIVAFLMLIVVGFGSMLFHGTLWRSMQLMDELPMLWCNGVFIYVVLTIEDPREVPMRVPTAIGLSALTLLETVLVTLFDKNNQNVFLMSYLGGVFFLVVASSRLNRKFNPKSTGLLMELAVLFYVLGGFVWLVDRNFCLQVRFLNLHAVWHLLASSGTFTSIVAWLYVRHVAMGDKPRIRGTVPLSWISVSHAKG